MILRKGSEVEVLNTREVPTGSWWQAEIISGNGRAFNVRYDHPPPGICNAVLERVPRKAIRPCPPALKLSCVPGDMIEAFHGGSWKIAEVMRVLDGNNFSVRLLGSSQALIIHLSKLRLRQAWEDNKWVVIKKNISRFCDGILPGSGKTELICQMPETCEEYQNEVIYGNINSKRYVGLLGSCNRHEKRKSESLLLPNLGNAQKIKKLRATQKDFVQQQLFVGRNICSKIETKCQKMKTNVVFPVGRSAEDDNLESNARSTCSSSGSNYPDVSAGCRHDLDDHSDNAHSFPPDTDAEVHEMELHAYYAVMKALYASGPISWEQEALLTSLRLLLHISTDEHLSVVRHLLSGPDMGVVKLASKVRYRGLTILLSLRPMQQLPFIFTMLVSFCCFSVNLSCGWVIVCLRIFRTLPRKC